MVTSTSGPASSCPGGRPARCSLVPWGWAGQGVDREEGVAEPRGPQDAPVKLLPERVAGGRLDDQAEQDVAGVE